MSYKAVFIGGAFDMTKRVLTSRRDRVFFYEPRDPYLVTKLRVPEEMVPCRELSYRLVFELSDQTGIYELESTD